MAKKKQAGIVEGLVYDAMPEWMNGNPAIADSIKYDVTRRMEAFEYELPKANSIEDAMQAANDGMQYDGTESVDLDTEEVTDLALYANEDIGMDFQVNSVSELPGALSGLAMVAISTLGESVFNESMGEFKTFVEENQLDVKAISSSDPLGMFPPESVDDVEGGSIYKYRNVEEPGNNYDVYAYTEGPVDYYFQKSASKKTAAPNNEENPMDNEIPQVPESLEFTEDNIKKELAEAIGDDIEDFDDIEEEAVLSSYGEGTVYLAGGQVVAESEDVVEEIAKAVVLQDLTDSPEMFTQSWLMAFVDEDALLEDFRSDIESMVYDSPESYTNFINEAEPEDDGEYSEDQKEEMAEGYLADIGNDIMDWLKGMGYEGEGLMKLLRPHIDLDEAVSLDGWAHFLSHYDGNYDTTDAGFVYWRES